MMKRWISVILACVLMFSGCGTNNKTSGTGKKIAVTIFPEYDWIMNILGDNPADMDVTLLLDSGADLHSYQPSAQDIMKIADCDLFVCVGGESDAWVDDALKESVNPNLRVVKLLDVLGTQAKQEETVEGMEAEEEGEEEEEEIEYDEHIWLSPRTSIALVRQLADAVEELDPDNKETYEANTQAYLVELNTLDQEYRDAVENAEYDTLIFGDRFPFRYLTSDYGLKYYAAFKGCSAETEASFETILFLAGKMDELKLPHILKIEGSDGKIAQTIIDNTKTQDQEILTLNSMQGITSADIQNGVTYLQIMRDNLDVLKEALN